MPSVAVLRDATAMRRMAAPEAQGPARQPHPRSSAAEPATGCAPASTSLLDPPTAGADGAGTAPCATASPPVPPVQPAAAGSPGSARGVRPITPDPAPAPAAATPTASARATSMGAAPRCCRAAAARRGEGGSGSGGEGEAAGAALWRRVHAFVCCLVDSPALQSALCSLLLPGGRGEGEGEGEGGGAPEAARPLPGGAELQLALASMLALFLRAGYEQATEERLLACLWVMESFGDAWRSPASVCLGAYLKHLALFSPQLVADLTGDWPAAFQRIRTAVVAAQKELLARTRWRVRLDLHADIRPCFVWLFQAPASWRQLASRLAADGAPAPPCDCSPLATPPPAAWAAWAAHMRALCTHVRRQAARAAPVLAPAPPAVPPPSTKRQRIEP